MRYIDNEKFKQIEALANKGDEKAKDFLFNFMELSDEQANEYLSKIAVNNKDVDIKCAIRFLIEDENEAVNGYDRAILLETNGKNRKRIIDKLNEIKNDELEHIKELKELVKEN